MENIKQIKKNILLNYDLGLKGDYSSLYAFLDSHKALDCGNGNAAFAMFFSEDKFETILEELKQEISKAVNIEKTDRIYMTVTDNTCTMRGSFLFGGRKRAIWEGYGNVKADKIDEF
jgi:hypothetical protein